MFQNNDVKVFVAFNSQTTILIELVPMLLF